ncbi:MAG: endonuclease/exonuclease/phosphatase family protein [Actinomycetota bacterium]|nr:endonuclease/exonuclease/phosphatase family protein [Actinomycetota bacterium]
MSAEAKFKISSWNIMHGINLTEPPTNGMPVIQSADLKAGCEQLAVDVLAVQEIDQYQQRSHQLDQAEFISTHAKLPNYRFIPTLLGNPDEGKKNWQAASEVEVDLANTNKSARYGIALFTRYPVRRWHQLDLVGAKITTPIAIPGENGKLKLIWISDEPRAVLAAEVETELGLVLIATTHLSFVPGRNIRQLRTALSWLSQFDIPKVFLGDLNLPARFIQALTSWQRTPVIPTFPITKPKVQFDHILTSSDLITTEVQATKMPVGDHLMLSASINRIK